MSVRSFDAVDDLIIFTPGAVSFPFGSAWAVVWTDGSTGANQHIVTVYDTITNRFQLRIGSTLVPSSVWSGTASPAVTAIGEDQWVFVGVSKATGTAAARFHTYHYATGVWNHEDSATAVADATATNTNIRLGSNAAAAQLWDGRMLDVNILNSVVMTDAEFEAKAHYMSSAFGGDGVTWKVSLDQASEATSIRDLTGGGGDQSTIVGTTIGTESAPCVP